jgi:hypothetical protein
MRVQMRTDPEFILASWSKPMAIERARDLSQKIEEGTVALEILVQRAVLQVLLDGEFLQEQAASEKMISYVSALSKHHGIPCDLADVIRIHDECITVFKDLLTEKIQKRESAPEPMRSQKRTVLLLNSGVIGAVCSRLRQLPVEAAAATEREWIELCVLTMLGTQSRLTIKPMEQQLFPFILAKPGLTKIKTDRHIADLMSAWTSLGWITSEEVQIAPEPMDDIDDEE